MSADSPTPRPRVRTWSTWPQAGIPTSPDDWKPKAQRSHLARSAGIIAVAFVLSRMLGLLREIILSRLFGTSMEYSAYVSAFRIPDLLFLIIMAGAFGSAFIPVFAGLMADDKRAEAWRLASTVLNLSAVVLAVTGALCLVFAGPLVRGIVAPGASTEAQELTIQIMRLLLLSPVFLGLGIAAKGILEGQDRFTLPAFAPVVYNLATIVGAITLGRSIGIYGVAVGVVVGAVLYLLVEVPGLIQTGMQYRPTINLHTEGLREVGRLLGPRVIGQAAFQINFIVITSIAWTVGEASVSGLNYAWQLLMLPHGVIALSISTVIFPTMSRLFQTDDLPGMRDAFSQALKPLVFLSVPAAILLFFFRVPIVQTILQGGAFDETSTALVSSMLAWFAVGLLGYALVEVLTRAFYAMHDTKTPVAIGIAIIVVNILLAMALVDVMGPPALAFSLSASTTIEAIALALILRRRLGAPGPQAVTWTAKVVVLAVIIGGIAALAAPWLIEATNPAAGQRLLGALLLAISVFGIGLVYLASAWVLQVPELRLAVGMVSSRLPGTRRAGAE